MSSKGGGINSGGLHGEGWLLHSPSTALLRLSMYLRFIFYIILRAKMSLNNYGNVLYFGLIILTIYCRSKQCFKFSVKENCSVMHA